MRMPSVKFTPLSLTKNSKNFFGCAHIDMLRDLALMPNHLLQWGKPMSPAKDIREDKWKWIFPAEIKEVVDKKNEYNYFGLGGMTMTDNKKSY